MKVPNIENRVKEELAKLGVGHPGKNLLAAVSGGPDSVALAVILYQLGHLGAIAHCNFGLRDEAKLEQELVMALGKKLGVPVYVRRFEPASKASHESTQVWARNLRYAFFEELLLGGAFTHCLTAHHRDDHLETILMGLLRSHDTRMLMGIPAKRGPFLRPLLGIPKKALVDYCETNQIAFAIDASNLSMDYLRNQFRHKLIPVLEELNPSYAERLAEAADDLRGRDEWMDKIIALAAPQVISKDRGGEQLHLKALEMQQPPLPIPIMLAWWLRQHLWSGLEIREALKLIDATAGAEINFRNSILQRNHLGFSLTNSALSEDPSPILMGLGSDNYLFGQWQISLETGDYQGGDPKRLGTEHGVHYMDLSKVKFPLQARNWKMKDRMKPLGLRGSKKLSDIFADAHTGKSGKAEAFVLEDADGDIILLSGFRISAKVALEASSVAILRIHCRFVFKAM